MGSQDASGYFISTHYMRPGSNPWSQSAEGRCGVPWQK